MKEWWAKFRKHAACRQAEGLDLLLDFPQHLRPGLPQATGEKRGPQRQTDRPNTQTQTETETLLATATHQEEPSLSGKIATPHGRLDVKIRLSNLQEDYQEVELFQQL